MTNFRLKCIKSDYFHSFHEFEEKEKIGRKRKEGRKEGRKGLLSLYVVRQSTNLYPRCCTSFVRVREADDDVPAAKNAIFF